jgi:hypothetical protein
MFLYDKMETNFYGAPRRWTFLDSINYFLSMDTPPLKLDIVLWKLKFPLNIKIFLWYLWRNTKDNLANHRWKIVWNATFVIKLRIFSTFSFIVTLLEIFGESLVLLYI